MVHERTAQPDEKVVIEDHPEAEYRVSWDEIQNRVGIEHATKRSKTVSQGIYFDDPDQVGRLIEGLEKFKSYFDSSADSSGGDNGNG